ncbi:hypothetical protein LG634_35975 [Streptomyces bambusae]|uniref:hypothetical protein n=1 Tax=Streptomyces bambusae TaxID=1550616 RepID=UPI001CFFDDE3|nr:hypothetical protein [Streptomyces bambusae]MCB5170184.1 hypothetical protein [Streptomyces bambusae]
MSNTTTRRITTAVASALLGGALAAGAGIGWDATGNGIGWDSAGHTTVAQAAAPTKGSVVANGIGWD